ncbi:uncharacterized protein MONOS_11831 [Monocercomonoides exilis]|uniref:uncharacterized protein n=1 Tax=Monocercomonoides exilis TaxID=2049356 RepID=UPI00355A36B2|nr:hypothetical protein MONOS_11831 [Monocercomonoides exilis]|eukprot:MONOS_11831.1-p1 / transcript=MONOS_11831.1 / gene=MONOS_11831 / organism=Monocercomonoides_exilis_PA203 / gene_product=unspecified product / transcript_product=unspecified product / location=Mono_scaffold00616:22534-23688(+) / protein_length=366 / sequence_SO=supercontig / SO=protein_coding / is_pseudo=false
MIEEKKLSMEDAILLMKRIGYCKLLKDVWNLRFGGSSLQKRFEKMIIDEEKKKGEKNKMLLPDLCECFLSLNYRYVVLSETVNEICVSCLLKVALKKEESEETRKEAEMALLALSSIRDNFVKKELYLNEIKEIIKYHQENRNLTRLAYQSAWRFLKDRLLVDNGLEEVIVNELHLAREAARELEELSKCVNWKKEKEEEMGKETKEERVIEKWFSEIFHFLYSITLWNEELAGLIGSIVQVYQVAKDNYKEIGDWCIHLLRTEAERRAVNVKDLLKGRAFDTVLEEFQRPTLSDNIECSLLIFFINVSKRLEEKKKDEMKEAKRKELKRKMFEKMEEEGFEDIVASFYEKFSYIFANHNVFIYL